MHIEELVLKFAEKYGLIKITEVPDKSPIDFWKADTFTLSYDRGQDKGYFFEKPVDEEEFVKLAITFQPDDGQIRVCYGFPIKHALIYQKLLIDINNRLSQRICGRICDMICERNCDITNQDSSLLVIQNTSDISEVENLIESHIDYMSLIRGSSR